MLNHPTSTVAPTFSFKVLSNYSDALRRQLNEGLFIIDAGILNKRLEFNANVICRLTTTSQLPASDAHLKSELNQRLKMKNDLNCFVEVMSRVSNLKPDPVMNTCANELCTTTETCYYCCRLSNKKKEKVT